LAPNTLEARRKIGERVLLPRVCELDHEMLIIADGFSCREQIEMHARRKTIHVAELLRDGLLAPTRPQKFDLASIFVRRPSP
jgi:hypothetical protein